MSGATEERGGQFAEQRLAVVHCAARTLSGEARRHGTLHVVNVLPEGDSPSWVQQMQKIFQADACAIVDLLYETLPGGTIDQVLAELCQRKASLLRVRFQP